MLSYDYMITGLTCLTKITLCVQLQSKGHYYLFSMSLDVYATAESYCTEFISAHYTESTALD